MSTQNEPHRIYSFDDFTLDVDRGALLQADSDVKLRPKSFDVLSYLVQKHGRLVSREELLESIWGPTVVGDDAITQCLIDIRRAIDDPDHTRIRTVPRRGYLFDTPVELSSAPGIGLGDSTKTAVDAHRWRTLFASVVAILFVTTAIWWALDKSGKGLGEDTDIGSAAGSHSIAVLPFSDMSPSQDQEYFADGISEEILNLLTRVPELKVIARTSSFTFKGGESDIAEIAERLHVTHVLEGSIRKSEDKIRVTAQLVDASTSEHVWSETYDRTLEDIFEVQDDISAEVVRKLKITLLAPLPKTQETDPEAYRLYLQAAHLTNQIDFSKSEEAESLFRQALQVDPDLAPAWRELSRVLSRQIGTGPSLREDIRRTRDALRRALEIEPNDAASLAYRAINVMDFDGDIVQAARLFDNAISIGPSNEHVVRAAANFSRAFSRPEDAIAIGEYAVTHNPLCNQCVFYLSRVYRDAGRLDEAVVAIRKFISLFDEGEGELGLLMLLKGQPQTALELMANEPFEPKRLFGIAMALHDLGRYDEFIEVFAALQEAAADNRPWEFAQAYAWIGEKDAAFDALERAAELTRVQDDGEIIRWNPKRFSIKLKSPFFRPLHDDPRWQVFLEKYGVSAEQLADVRFEVTLPQ